MTNCEKPTSLIVIFHDKKIWCLNFPSGSNLYPSNKESNWMNSLIIRFLIYIKVDQKSFDEGDRADSSSSLRGSKRFGNARQNQQYQRLYCLYEKGFLWYFRQIVFARDITGQKLKQTSDLDINLPKFNGYDSEMVFLYLQIWVFQVDWAKSTKAASCRLSQITWLVMPWSWLSRKQIMRKCGLH